MNENTELLLSVQMMRKLYVQYLRDVGPAFGLQPADTDIISFLRFNPGMDTANDIVELRRLSKGSVSQTVERLAQKGYLRREEDPRDRRRTHLYLTEKAEPVVQAIQAKREAYTEMLFHGLSQKEIAEYTRLTRHLMKNAQAAWKTDRSDTGKASGDAGKTSGDTGKASGDTGKTSGDAGKT